MPDVSRTGCILAGRSRSAITLADRALRVAVAFPTVIRENVASDLFRQAIYWALLAHRDGLSPSEAAIPAAFPPSRDAFSALWSATDPELLARAAGGTAEGVRALRDGVVGKSFAHVAELTDEQQAELCKSLAAFAKGLHEPLDTQIRTLERGWLRRVFLVGAAAVLLVVVGVRVNDFLEAQELRGDLAVGATWKTSSDYYDAAHSCQSPQQVCANSPNFFFHTLQETEPSIVFDLGSSRKISKLIIENRHDCCKERALPLVVQISSDNRRWQTVATRAKPFGVWRERFRPVQGRWVRLLVRRWTLLHLARVRLLP